MNYKKNIKNFFFAMVVIVFTMNLTGCQSRNQETIKQSDNEKKEQIQLLEGEASGSMILEDQHFLYIYTGCEIIKMNQESKSTNVLWKSDCTLRNEY